MGALTFECIMIVYNLGMTGMMANIQLFPASASQLMVAGPLLCLPFSIQAGGGVVLSTMKDTSEENVKKVANGAYAVVFCMDLVIGLVAYFAFGAGVKADIIENLPSHAVPSVIARACLLVLVVLSYMIMMIPCKVSMLDFVFGKNEALQESTVAQFYGTTVVLNILALVVAVAVTDLSLINGMNGSICTNFNAFIMPAAFFIKARSDPSDPMTQPVPVMSASNIPFFLIIAFGVSMLTMGSYQLAQTMLA